MDMYYIERSLLTRNFLVQRSAESRFDKQISQRVAKQAAVLLFYFRHIPVYLS